MALEELHRSLVLLRGRARLERAEIPALSRFRIDLARIQAVFAGAEFTDHRSLHSLVRIGGPIAEIDATAHESVSSDSGNACHGGKQREYIPIKYTGLNSIIRRGPAPLIVTALNIQLD